MNEISQPAGGFLVDVQDDSSLTEPEDEKITSSHALIYSQVAKMNQSSQQAHVLAAEEVVEEKKDQDDDDDSDGIEILGESDEV